MPNLTPPFDSAGPAADADADASAPTGVLSGVLSEALSGASPGGRHNAALRRLRQAWRTASAGGDWMLACHSARQACSAALIRGRSLAGDHEEAVGYLSASQGRGVPEGVALVTVMERTTACLLGRTRGMTDFGDDTFDAPSFERDVARLDSPTLARAYWASRTMLCFLAGDPAAALSASRLGLPAREDSTMSAGDVETLFFTALAICGCLRNVTTRKPDDLRRQLARHASTIRQWALDTCEMMFVSRHLLLSAEIASLDGDVLEAQKLYEAGGRVAHKDRSPMMEGLVKELASRFYSVRGFERIGDAYLDDAIECYARWGADAKVAQLTRTHPRRRGPLPGFPDSGLTVAPAGTLDQAGASRVLRSVSGELVTEQLITTLMCAVVEHAGAGRAVLLLSRNDVMEIAAEVTTEGEATRVNLFRDEQAQPAVPDSVIRFAMRTGESVIVDDALVDSRFRRDPYVLERRVRSALCLPILGYRKLQAILYLENNLVASVFTQAHLDVLQLLATQAAISIENTRLYADLEIREYKLRRIFEVDVIGIVFWDLNGQLLDANDAFLRMVGYTREDLENGTMRWFDMTPPEWQDQVVREVQELRETGALRPLEKEYFRKDGSRLPVLMGAAVFEGSVQQGVALIVDLSKQKEAEARALAVERSNRMLHAELTHANRLVTMGHLSAWIAHDVKQPLAGLVTSGNAALCWLDADPPNVGAAVRALERVVRDSVRAADILDRTTMLVRKAPPEAEAVDIDEVIVETLSLVSAEAAGKGIAIRLQLHTERLFAAADRIQIQQVILNLLSNAMDAMSAGAPGERLELRVCSALTTDGGVAVEVHDTGPGLPTPHSEDCFDAFYSTKPQGLGIGLAICRSIVETFGGTISAAANVPRGASFRFVVPRFSRNAGGAQMARDGRDGSGQRGGDPAAG